MDRAAPASRRPASACRADGAVARPDDGQVEMAVAGPGELFHALSGRLQSRAAAVLHHAGVGGAEAPARLVLLRLRRGLHGAGAAPGDGPAVWLAVSYPGFSAPVFLPFFPLPPFLSRPAGLPGPLPAPLPTPPRRRARRAPPSP